MASQLNQKRDETIARVGQLCWAKGTSNTRAVIGNNCLFSATEYW